MTDVEETRKGSALKAMVSFFTIWQQDITQEDMDAMERKFHLAPAAGLLFAAAIIIEMSVLLLMAVHLGFGSGMVAAAVVMATVYVGSRFIHFDGLTDFGDGMVVAGTREDHVRALKDTLVGAGGLGVAVTVTILSFSLYSYAGFLLLVFAPMAEICVKNAMVSAAAFGTPGNGMAGRQVGMTTTSSIIPATVIALVLSIAVGLVGALLYNAIIDPPWAFAEVDLLAVVFCAVFAVVASIAAGYLMARKANSVFGMVNGDILGATNEIARPLVMIVMLIPYVAWM